MDIKDLNKPQLILLALLISFVVSLATGIVTVSLMQQMPKSVPQTINNVIQRTIEKVTTVPTPTTDKSPLVNAKNALVGIYPAGTTTTVSPKDDGTTADLPPPIGHGVLVSDSGLVLIDSSTISGAGEEYAIPLDGTFYTAKLVKKFEAGFSILVIMPKGTPTDEKKTNGNGAQASAGGAIVDKTN